MESGVSVKWGEWRVGCRSNGVHLSRLRSNQRQHMLQPLEVVGKLPCQRPTAAHQKIVAGALVLDLPRGVTNGRAQQIITGDFRRVQHQRVEILPLHEADDQIPWAEFDGGEAHRRAGRQAV